MINKIGIIGGTGKMGTAFKNAFESIGLEVLISDESSPEKEKNIIKNCDWIILSVPIDQTVSVFNRIKNNISKDQIFSDFTSVKSILLDHVQECEFEFISCHPLFGPLNNFNGQNIVTIQVNTSEKHIYIDKIFKKSCCCHKSILCVNNTKPLFLIFLLILAKSLSKFLQYVIEPIREIRSNFIL